MKSFYAILVFTHLLVAVDRGFGHNIARGNDTASYGGRILHGRLADPYEFLYVVRLMIEDDDFCGGSIVSHFYVLTAAHCIHEKNCQSIAISPSYWARGDKPKFHAEQCTSHESFPADNPYDYDIGMVRTKENLIIDGWLAEATLPPPLSTVPDDDTPAVILGWGVDEDDYIADFLKRGDVFVLNWEVCKCRFSICDNCPEHVIPKASICVIGKGDKPDGACSGDSGGPVIIDGVVRGIITFVITTVDDKCVVGSPALTLSVADFMHWITDHS